MEKSMMGDMKLSRREALVALPVGASAVAGCLDIQVEPRGSSDITTEPTPSETLKDLPEE